jgi:hypothetical protein
MQAARGQRGLGARATHPFISIDNERNQRMSGLTAAARRAGWREVKDPRDGSTYLERSINPSTGHVMICTPGSGTWDDCYGRARSADVDSARTQPISIATRPARKTRASSAKNQGRGDELAERRRVIAKIEREQRQREIDAIENEVPELRPNTTPSLAVRIDRSGKKLITEEIALYRDILDQDGEIGGWLFADYERGKWILSPKRLENATPKRSAISHPLDDARDEAAIVRGINNDRQFLLGTWHTHPGWRSRTPSSTDRKSALRILERLDGFKKASFELSLIVTPDGDRGWGKPHFHAWKTYRTSAGTSVTEPAILDIATL